MYVRSVPRISIESDPMNRPFTFGPLLALALVSAPAASQPSEPPGPPTNGQSPSATVVDLDAVEARKAFEDGVTAYQNGDYESAAERFGHAQLLKPHPEVLLNLAQSQLKARQYAQAATSFQGYLTQTQRENATARNGLADAKTQVAEVSILAPEGVAIVVNQTPVGNAPLPQPLYLVPGRHEVLAGGRSQTIQANAGTSETVDLLNEVLPPPPATTAVSEGPTKPRRLPVDKWFVERPGAWVGAGITVGSLVFSAVAATTSGRRYDAANDAKHQILQHYAANGSPGLSPCGPPPAAEEYSAPCSTYEDKVDSGDTWRTASIVTLIVGVVAASGTIAYYYIDPENRAQPEAPTLDLNADPTTGSYSLGLNGRF